MEQVIYFVEGLNSIIICYLSMSTLARDKYIVCVEVCISSLLAYQLCYMDSGAGAGVGCRYVPKC